MHPTAGSVRLFGMDIGTVKRAQLPALRRRIGDDSFFALLREWTSRYRHASVVTDDFIALAAHFTEDSLRPLWAAGLYSAEVPPLDLP